MFVATIIKIAVSWMDVSFRITMNLFALRIGPQLFSLYVRAGLNQ